MRGNPENIVDPCSYFYSKLTICPIYLPSQNEPTLLEFFYAIRRQLPAAPAKLIANLLINDVLSACHKHRIGDLRLQRAAVTAEHIAELVTMLLDETLNLILARLVLDEMLRERPAATPAEAAALSPRQIAERNGWQQISDAATIESLCADVLAANPKAVAQYRKGKTKILYGLAGEIVKRTEQRANMARVVAELTAQLAKE